MGVYVRGRITLFAITVFTLFSIIIFPNRAECDVNFEVHPKLSGVALAPYLSVLEDFDGNLTIDDVSSEKYSGRFSKRDGQYFNFGNSDSAFWFRIHVSNLENEEVDWILELAYPLIDYLDLYKPDGKGGYETTKTGAERPFHTRESDYANFTFSLREPPRSHTTYFLRVQTEMAILLPFKAWARDNFSRNLELWYLFLGIYFGITFVMMSYNFLLAISFRDINYLYYVIYLLFMGLSQFSYHGLAYQFHWAINPTWNYLFIMIFTWITYICGMIFSRQFLNTKLIAPMLDKVLKLLITTGLVSILLTFLLSKTAMSVLLNSILATLFILLAAGILSWSRGFRPARYYVIAWSFFLFGITVFGLRNLGIIEYSFTSTWTYMFGSALETILLSLALGDRVNLINEEKNKVAEALREIEAKFMETTMNFPGVVYQFMINKDGSFAFPFVSESSNTLMGISAKDFENDPNLFFDNLLEEDKKPFVDSIIESANTMNGWEHNFQYPMQDKSLKWFEGKSIPHLLPTGEPLWNGVILDITERILAEQELAEKDRLLKENMLKAKSELEKKVVERTKDLRETNEKLLAAKHVAEEATKLRDDFLSLVSHDMRSPLTGILSMVGVVNKPDPDGIYELKKKDVLVRVERIVNGLVGMIDQLMNISRLKTGKLKPMKRYCNLQKLVDTLIGNLAYQAEAKDIKLVNSIPVGTRVYADYSLLGEVIQNLVYNAIKFSNKKGSVTVGAEKEDREGDASDIFTFSVKDEGVGIEGSRLKALLRHDKKTSTTGTAGETGTGLGLPFCNDILMAHDGNLRIESADGVGSTFFVDLPIVKTIVIVADDQEVQRSIMKKLILEIPRTDVVEASDGTEVLEILKEVTPSIIITDLYMPKMDGFELLAEIKKRRSLKGIPILVSSAASEDDSGSDYGFSNQELNAKVLELGATDFFSKPIIDDEFIQCIKRFI